ncbi:MAG: family metallopeptidase [Solirubrobacterales bacterium]|nr:family metallopeptidase [Solirubrobacterales bacterium]
MPGSAQNATALVCGLIASAVAATPAAAGSGGATAAGAGGGVGGAEYGMALKQARPPQATRFSVTPGTVTAGGNPPSIVLRIDSGDGGRVQARVVFQPARGSGGAVLQISLGRVRVGRTIRIAWPRGKTLQAGRYVVRVHATDVGGLVLERRRRTPGRAALTVQPKPKPAPVTPAPAPTPPPLPPPTVGSGVFPVQGPHAYGDLFGAQRSGYRHQGVDISAAQGTPIVSPTAGTIRFTDYQASAAGEYIVERLADGRDVFYAHCVRHSTVVRPGQAVPRGARLCDLGQTGDATGPHLHLELWPAGWRDVQGTSPADPLPQLRAWDGLG